MIRRFSVSIVGRVLGAVLQLLILGLVARSLGVDLFGLYSITIAVTYAVVSFFEFGMGVRVYRGTRTQEAQAALTTFWIIRGALLILLPFVCSFISERNGVDSLLVLAASVYAFGESIGDVAVGIYQGNRRSTRAMLLLISRRLLAILPLILWGGVFGVEISAFVSGSLGIVWFFILSINKNSRPMGIIKLIKQNLGIIATSGATNFAPLDIVLVGITLGPTGAGFYAAGTRLFNSLKLPITTMLQVLTSELAAHQDNSVRLEIFKKVRWTVTVLAIFMIGASSFAPELIRIIFGGKFQEARSVVVCVVIASAISSIGDLYLSWFYSRHIPTSVPFVTWFGVALGLSIVFLFSSNFGLVGAGVGLIAMNLLVGCGMYFVWRFSIKKLITKNEGNS